VSRVTSSAVDTENRLAIEHFAAKLRFETDPSDVATALATGDPGFRLVDSRSAAAWALGHLPGALHLPTAELSTRLGELDPAMPVVTYCWGPGCNGATRSALALARRGFSVRELIGGYEYWVREGFEVQTATGLVRRPSDPLTTVPAAACDC
jgi:rhodanese-related sulfurtransferase